MPPRGEALAAPADGRDQSPGTFAPMGDDRLGGAGGERQRDLDDGARPVEEEVGAGEPPGFEEGHAMSRGEGGVAGRAYTGRRLEDA